MAVSDDPKPETAAAKADATTVKSGVKPDSEPSDAREQRLADALRANLKRRKVAAKKSG